MFDIAAALIVLTAVFAYLNHRYIGLPTTIGVMGIALLMSLALIGLDALGFTVLHDLEVSLVSSIDFSDVVIQGMLSLLIFAGALHVKVGELRRHRLPVLVFAGFSTVASALIIGYGLAALLPLLGITLPLAWCLIFGALISPTDPIAVMGILGSAKAPKNLQTVIAGESLLNDGIGLVLFSLFYALIVSGQPPTAGEALLLFARDGLGGLLFGWGVGYLAYRMLKSIDNYQVEVLITIAAVMGGYALADRLNLSGPLAMVSMGLVIGNRGRQFAMSDTTRKYVDLFWEVLDEILNSVLFVLIGLEIVLLTLPAHGLIAALAAIAVALVARLVSVGTPIALLGRRFQLPPGSWKLFVWGGLRGGISVALALSLPPGPNRDVVLAMTYAVVAFSILVQGLSFARLVRRTIPATALALETEPAAQD